MDGIEVPPISPEELAGLRPESVRMVEALWAWHVRHGGVASRPALLHPRAA